MKRSRWPATPPATSRQPSSAVGALTALAACFTAGACIGTFEDGAAVETDAAVDTSDSGTSPYMFHPREEWQSASQPVTGPDMDLLALRYITIHYNGDNRDLEGDYGGVLRAMHSSWLSSRGYSLGYNSGIAPDGDEWQIRGLDFRSAANGCQAVNVPGYAIQITVPNPAAPPTEAQIEGTRQAVARVRAAAIAAGNPEPLYLNGHGDVRPLCGNGGTACPGEPITELLRSGAFER